MTLSYSHAHQQGSGTTEVVAVLVAITDHIARVLTVDQGKLLPNGHLCRYIALYKREYVSG
ncbi:hypothetical protein [Psychrobacter sp. JCM 18900]|uniref:hypothetical protein n=1 Tax=Psychrobacter sp. JCM 18900 TaxID=1298608 RepID=UPI0004B94D5D